VPFRLPPSPDLLRRDEGEGECIRHHFHSHDHVTCSSTPPPCEAGAAPEFLLLLPNHVSWHSIYSNKAWLHSSLIKVLTPSCMLPLISATYPVVDPGSVNVDELRRVLESAFRTVTGHQCG
jgi:hypothetical protein